MYKRLPPLNSLKSFESAARHLSFTKAADELFVTQAAVSHQIKLLEDFLGIELFKRKNRALELTELGKTYFADINKVLRKLNEVTERLLSSNTDPHLSISVPQTFGIQWLVPHLSEFNRLHPEIEVRLKGVDHDEGLLSKEIDLAIYYGKGDWQNLQVDGLGKEDLLILASPKLLAENPIHNKEDLKHHTLIHTHMRDNWRAMANYLSLDDVNIQQGPLFSHTFMALQAAVHGQGIALANRLLALQEIEQGALQIVLPTDLPDPKSFYVVNHLDRLDDEKIQAFRRWIINTIKKKNMNKLALYCRPGFEKEVAAEITDRAAALGVFGFARMQENSGYVIFECYQPDEADRLAREIPFNQLIFARQMLVVSDLLDNLEPTDRISPIVNAFKSLSEQVDFKSSYELFVETPDTNEAKSLSTFCRKFTVPLRQALKKQGWLNGKHSKCGLFLHCFFVKPNCCYVGYSYSNNHSEHFMGIPRLKFPSEAPSRSTLKLDEAILTFIPHKDETKRLNETMIGVDLGACPGGWTYQLVKRGLFVYAVDHGKMAESLHETGRIEHCAEDGFKFQPPKRKKVDWLVCDMVEQPSRIANLIGKWLINGWCRETIFNLKLPMKKRYQEVMQCLESLSEALNQQGLTFEMQAKQLYHDREEVTVHIALK